MQVGTCLLASEECPIHQNYKDKVVAAGVNDTVVTGRPAGAPVRCLKNKMTKRYLELERTDTKRDELEALTLGSLRRAVFDGDVDTGSFMCGQVAGMVHEVRPVRAHTGGPRGRRTRGHSWGWRCSPMALAFLFAGQGSQHAGMGGRSV